MNKNVKTGSPKIHQKPRGTLAEFGGLANLFDLTIKEVSSVITLYGVTFTYIPTFEYADLFLHSIGSDSDIVNKELYAFADRKGRMLALRPEGTASIMRMVIENKLVQSDAPSALKFYYHGPMFRYERPQNQRRREFLQIGVEYINGNSAVLMLELIQMVHQILTVLNLHDHVNFYVNSIGTVSERQKYAVKVRDYFEKSLPDLCSDCQLRYHKNVFRIADCKKEPRDLITNMPNLYEYISEEEKNKFNNLLNDTKFLNINLKFNKSIVRGLDYYDSIVFEVVSKENDLAVIAGGSYDKLSTKLGSHFPITACGFAIGVERLALLWWKHNKENQIFVNPEHHQKFFIYSDDQEHLIFTALLGKMFRENGLFVTSSNKQKLNLTKLYDLCLKRGYTAIIYYQNSSVYYDEKMILQNVKVFNLPQCKKEIVPVVELLEYVSSLINEDK